MNRTTTHNPWARFGRRPLVAPSLLSADFMHLADQIATVTDAGADILHVDVMDGHFVPNLAISPGVVKSIRRGCNHFLDAHLMVTDPLLFAKPFIEAGVDSLTFHVESDSDPRKMIETLRRAGIGVGVTVKPGTGAETVKPYAGDVDLVLVMTVEPGFGGQSFMADQVDKIRAVRDLVGPDVRVEVDGGIDPGTAATCVEAGADTFVAGASVFGAADIPAALKALARSVSSVRTS